MSKTIVAELDQQELAVRILEAMIGTPRPAGMTAAQVIAGTDEDIRDKGMAAAMAAMTYFRDQTAAARRVQ